MNGEVTARHPAGATFHAHDGRQIMVYAPPDPPPARRVGLFLFNSGHKYRVGPHDLYVKLALQLTARGYFVVTPDPAGAGDGFAGFRQASVDEHHRTIGDGAHVAGARADIAHFRRALSLDAVVVSGLCGGARTAIGAAVADRAISGVVAWTCPFQVPGRRSLVHRDPVAVAPEGPAIGPVSGAMAASPAPSPAAWRARLGRLRRGEIDWKYNRERLRVLLARLRGRHPSFNHRLASEIFRLEARDLPLLFLYSERDNHYLRFRDYYLPWRSQRSSRPVAIEVLPRANHVVDDPGSFGRLVDIFSEFCGRFA